MIVTTGGRGTRSSPVSGVSKSPFLDIGLGDPPHRVAEFLGDELRRVGVDDVSVIFAIWPCFIRSLMTSTPRSDMRLASSWIVIVSGDHFAHELFFCLVDA